MTEPEKKESTPPPQPPSVMGIPMASILSIGAGLVGKLLEASPLGIATAGIFGLVSFFAIRMMIKKFNSYIDKRDDEKAGAMVGENAVDLRNQSAQVNQGLNQAQAMDPPKKDSI